MIKNLLAKSKENGSISLIDHSIAVTNFIDFIFKRIINQDAKWSDEFGYSMKDLYDDAISAGAFHDIGKCTKSIQDYLSKPITKGYYQPSEDLEPIHRKQKSTTHNVYGWAYLNGFTNAKTWVNSSALFHHVVYDYITEKTTKNIVGEMLNDIDTFNMFFDYMSGYIKEKFNVSRIERREYNRDNEFFPIKSVPLYYEMNANKAYEDLDESTKYFLTRAILIYADRAVSHFRSDIDSFINYDESFMDDVLSSSIENENFPIDNINDLTHIYTNKERLESQNELLSEINNHKNVIVGASAGYGKTLIGIRWILKHKQKVLWVVPRNVIASGTYHSIVDECNKMGIGDKISVALLLHGDYIHGNESSDIIVTNIDNFLGNMTQNALAHNLIKVFGANVIFDEFHEFFCNEPLFAAFISVVYARTSYTNTRTLMLSASPYMFQKMFWKEEDVVYIEPKKQFNENMKVNIHVQQHNNLDDFDIPSKDTFVIANTVKQAQKLYGINHDIPEKNLIHSKFTDDDRSNIENAIYEKHDKHSDVSKRNTVIGTNIIGVGLDVSAKNIMDFVISPENTIQRGCGRGGRFAEDEYDNQIDYTICVLENDSSVARLTTEMYDKGLNKKWSDLIKSYDGKSLTKKELYQLYHQFYEDNKDDVFEMWKRKFNNSSSKLCKMVPYSTYRKKQDKSKKLGTNLGYRGLGKNIFVVAKLKDGAENDYSEPLTFDRDMINKDEITNTYAVKKRRKYYEELIDNFKYMYKDKVFEKDDCYRLAINYDTPMLLCYYTYDPEYGLKEIGI